MLWHFTAERAPQGNIGKWGDGEIADGCAWDGDGIIFLTALTQSGWVDASEKHRLVVHDWHEHADSTVRKYLDYHSLRFLSFSGVSPRKSGESRRISGLARGNGNGNGNGKDVLVLNGGGVGEGRSGEAVVERRKVRRRGGVETPWPAGFALTDDLRTFAEDGGFDAGSEFGSFHDKAIAKGWTYVDWAAGFKTWCRNEKKFRDERRRG